jgi:DNA-binding CsgD family transcriptional regulator
MLHSRPRAAGRNNACMAEALILHSPNPNWAMRPAASIGALAASCFEAHPDPQLVFNADYVVVASNRAARELLERAQGARALAESLIAGPRELPSGVRAGIAAAIHMQTPSGEISLSGSLSLTARIVPLAPAFDLALLTLRAHEPSSSRATRARFSFTPMESRVAELLSRGLSAKKIAQELGISIETVRCHLKQAFVKAGVHRQAELVAVMLGR